MSERWMAWARRIQAIAQTGATYARDPYDQQRYRELSDIAAEIIAEHIHVPAVELAQMFAAEKGYPTPKVDIRAVVFEQNKVLLVREREDGAWSLPGGWADVGETPREVAAREVLEEAGYAVRPTKLLAVFDKSRHEHPPTLWYCYKLFVRCELLGGEATTSIETDAVGFFARDALPALSIERVTASQIARMFEHHDAPDLPTDLD